MYGFQISCRVIRQAADFILPVNDVFCRNFRQLPLFEIREDFLLDDALLGQPGIQFQLGLDVLLI